MCEGDKSEREGAGHRDRESPEMSCSSHDADVSHGNETREKLNNKVTLTRSRNKQKRPLESDCELDNARASLRDCASSLPCTSHSDIESEKERTKGLSVTPGELKRIHCMIEQCIVRGYDKEETVAILFGVAGIDCRISGLLWDQLRARNAWFFDGYDIFLGHRNAMDEHSESNRKRKRVYCLSPG